jgi:hypothetical protein
MLTDIRILRPLPGSTQRVRCGSEELVRLVVRGNVADTFLGGRGRYTFGAGIGRVGSVHRLSYDGNVRLSSCHAMWLKTCAFVRSFCSQNLRCRCATCDIIHELCVGHWTSVCVNGCVYVGLWVCVSVSSVSMCVYVFVGVCLYLYVTMIV